jgi:hypothetical protein
VLLACIEVRSEAHKFDSFMFLPLNFVQIDDGENKRKDGKFKAVKKKGEDQTFSLSERQNCTCHGLFSRSWKIYDGKLLTTLLF